METALDDFNGKMKVIKSENNKLFYDYIRFLGSMKQKASALNPDNELQRQELDSLVKSYQKNNILNKELLSAKAVSYTHLTLPTTP